TKNPVRHHEMASLTFDPRFIDAASNEFEVIEFPQLFENPTPGANFSFGRGLGVGVFVEHTGPTALSISQVNVPHRAWIEIRDVQLKFVGKERKEDVTV